MRLSIAACVVAMGLFGCLTARADIVVGDKPTLQFKAMDGTQVDLKDLRGKLVIVDFWAAGDATRSGERRLVEIQRQHTKDGVAILGICCDRDKVRAEAFMKELGMTWPQCWDGDGFNGRVPSDWGFRHLGAILIGSDGTVLWVGFAGELNRHLQAELIQRPPTIIDPDLLAKSVTELDGVEKSLKDNDPVAAIKRFGTISPLAKQNPGFAKRLADVEPKIADAGKQLFAQVDALIEKKQYSAAADQLAVLGKTLDGTPLIGDVRTRTLNLEVNPEAKSQLVAARQEREANDQLAAARKLRDAQQNEQAYLKFKALMQDYPNTQAAQAAGEMVRAYEQDPKFVERVQQQIVDAKARSMFSMARSYAGSGRADLARQRYQEIIEQFPNTRHADTAKLEMQQLAKN